jgi:hypothetical protein
LIKDYIKIGSGLNWLSIGSYVGFGEHNGEVGLYKKKEFIDQLSQYELFVAE